MMRVITTAASKSFSPEAIAQTTAGATRMPTTLVATTTHASTVATESISRCVTSSPSAARVFASSGTKACENAPSANSRRSRFGMRKATLYASVQALAPKFAAMSCSRASPEMREASVSSEHAVDAVLRRFIATRRRRGGEEGGEKLAIKGTRARIIGKRCSPEAARAF